MLRCTCPRHHCAYPASQHIEHHVCVCVCKRADSSCTRVCTHICAPPPSILPDPGMRSSSTLRVLFAASVCSAVLSDAENVCTRRARVAWPDPGIRESSDEKNMFRLIYVVDNQQLVKIHFARGVRCVCMCWSWNVRPYSVCVCS